MKKLKYYVLDVFTDQRYKGNQLSVVHTEDELTLQQYHDISREFGYSETSFIHYSSKENALKVRSFTKAEFEVVGAGHTQYVWPYYLIGIFSKTSKAVLMSL